jgi:hypothetical protein
VCSFRRKLLKIKNLEGKAVLVIGSTPSDPDEREVKTRKYK